LTEILTMGEMLVEIMRPRAGLPLYEPAEFLGPYPSGAPAIFIDTVARLGHSAGIIGGVADDDFGRCLLDRLAFDGVDLRFVVKISKSSTATAFVTYLRDGSRRFIFHLDGTPAVMGRFPAAARREKPIFFHVMGCSLMINKAFRDEIFKAVEFFCGAGAKITFDPNIRFELLRGMNLMDVVEPVLKRTSVLLPGEAELKLLGGSMQIEESVRRLFKSPRLEMIVLKRGKDGARIYTGSETIETAAIPVQEVDPTGAGDCFDAGFLCGLLEQKNLPECGKLAAAVGALNAAAFGPMEGKISKESVQKLIFG
jgi:sugar/nucleoside kinase (ribokinase family)